MSETKKSWWQRLKEGVSKTRTEMVERVREVISLHGRLDEELYEQLEEVLIGADVGVETSLELVERLRQAVRRERVQEPEEAVKLLQQEIERMLGEMPAEPNWSHSPTVVMLVGVNGAGKTTTIGKLAQRYQSEGKKVLLAAADTFRAAASEQLAVWAERADVDLVQHRQGADPGAVVFDALQAARARRCDLLLVDTAGRLHNKSQLMEELKKLRRICEREVEGAPHEVWLVIDATSGQNALIQAEVFKEAVEITGVVVTKLDGTAKGGVALAIRHRLDVPIRFIGVGESIEDLQPFSPEEFSQALFDEGASKE